MTIIAPPPPTNLAGLIGMLAKRISVMGNGPAADLRRLRADAEDRWRSATFYRLYADVIAPRHRGGDDHERNWAMILAGLARLAHAPGRNAGATLAEEGFAERRLVRLLDADGDHLASELRATISFLAAKGAAVNWIDLAELVLTHATERRDDARRKIAAAYYRSLTTSSSSAAKA